MVPGAVALSRAPISVASKGTCFRLLEQHINVHRASTVMPSGQPDSITDCLARDPGEPIRS